MSGQLVERSRQGSIVQLTLNRPPLNAFDDELIDALSEAVNELAADESVRCAVIAGGRHFAAGADIQRLAQMGFEEIVPWNARLQKTFTRVADLPIPIIAALRGAALGGGLELALCADYRVGDSSVKLGLPEIKLGIIPGSGGTQRLTQIVGRSRAKELIMTGRSLGAAEASARGLLDEVIDRPVERAWELAGLFAASPRFAIRAVKEAVDAGDPVSDRGLALERALMAGLFATADAGIGLEHFLSEGTKRPAPFRGLDG